MSEAKIDLYKTHKTEYAAPRKPALVTIGKAWYLAIEGQGAPGSKAFTASIGALYGVAFTVKMTRKFSGRQDYTVCKLEAQWWSDGRENFSTAPKHAWQWKLLIRTPQFVTQEDVNSAVAVLLKRGKGKDVERVRLEPLSEGQCVQMLHVGPYDDEQESLNSMQAFAESKGLIFHGRHHEIYLSDPRRVAAEKLRTILRMPVTSQAGS
jgi:hypothetical protein